MMAIFFARFAPGIGIAVALAAALFVGWNTAYSRGEAAEKVRWTAAQAAADRLAEGKLASLNERTTALQATLTTKLERITALEKESTDEKATSTALQSQLAAGERRLSVLVRVAAGQAAAAQSPAGTATGAVDPGRAISASLDGRSAADLEWLRQTRSDALFGLSACIKSYDAVKAAADAQP